MKKIITFICILTMLSVLTLSGCKDPDTDKPVTNGNTDLEDVIFGGDFTIVIPEDFDLSEGQGMLDIIDAAVLKLTGKSAVIKRETEGEAEHEIILGETDRRLSSQAYNRLDTLKEGQDGLIGYYVYSDGKSIAIAYDSEESLELAIKAFAESYLSEAYGKDTVSSGVLLEWTYELDTLYDERDAVIMNERWAKLEEEVNKAGYNGKETVTALRKLYSLYSDKIYLWMADLWDPVTGGFYYSNSGRDTIGFAPDIESTMQVLNFIRYSGMNSDLNSLPESMKKSIVEFIKSCQSSADGYFYHPQWADKVTTDERRGRDQTWAVTILKIFGEKPLYTTGGLEGSLGDPGATPSSHLTSRFGRDYKFEISRVVACAATLDHLQSEESFRAYLDSQDWSDAYVTGNRIAAQVTSIKAAGLLDFCISYLNEKQRDNGMWDDQVGDRATNGFLKIAAVYETAGAAIPRSKEASEFLLDVIKSPDEPGTVCWVYNVWYALDIINTRLYAAGGEENIKLADSILDNLRKNAASYITIAAEKYAIFAKRDGSFSFNPRQSANLSQGMPVAVKYKNEGDVNGTYISSIGLIGYIFDALRYERVEPYTENDYKKFEAKILNAGEVIKTVFTTGGEVIFDDLNDLDDVFYDIAAVVLNMTPDQFTDEDPTSGYAVITEDLEQGTVLEFGKPLKCSEDLHADPRIEFPILSEIGTRYVFEFDMKYISAKYDEETWHSRFTMFYNSTRFWYLYLYTLPDGNLAMGSLNDPIAVIKPGEWHNIRFEYYTDAGDGSCKMFLDDKYLGEVGESMPGFDSSIARAFIEYRHQSYEMAFQFDNVLAESDNVAYAPPAVEPGDSIGSAYQDAFLKGDRYDYDAEDAVLPALRDNVGKLEIVDGRLQFTLKDASAQDAIVYERPISAVESKYFKNICKIVELEFSYSGITGDEPIKFIIGNQEYALVKNSETGKLDILDPNNDNKIIALGLEADKVYVLRFECYAYAEKNNYNITKLYVDEVYAGQLRSKYTSAVTTFAISMDATLAGTDAYITVENVLLSNVNREYVRDESEPPLDDEGDSVEQSPFGGGAFYKNESVIGNRYDYTELVEVKPGEIGIQTDGVTWNSTDRATVTEGVLVYTRNDMGKESYLRWNPGDPVDLETPIFVFETDFRFDGFKRSTPQQKIVLFANGVAHQIDPVFAEVDGVMTMALGTMILNEAEWYNIRFELDYETGKVHYFLNGEYQGSDYISKTSVSYANARILWYYRVNQTGGSMSYDNTFFNYIEEGTICSEHTDADGDGKCDNCPLDMPKEGEDDKEEITIPENTVGGGVYYKGTASGLRLNLDTSTGTKTDGISAPDTAEFSDGMFKFFRNNIAGGKESYIRFNLTPVSGVTSPVLVYETDFFFDGYKAKEVKEDGRFARFDIRTNGQYIQVPITADSYSVGSEINTVKFGKMALDSGKWYSIRFVVEYGADNNKLTYYCDGVKIAEEDFAKTSNSSNMSCWYFEDEMTGGVMAFDNFFVGTFDCAKHTDADGDGNCDNCYINIEEHNKVTEPVIPDEPDVPDTPVIPDTPAVDGVLGGGVNIDPDGWANVNSDKNSCKAHIDTNGDSMCDTCGVELKPDAALPEEDDPLGSEGTNDNIDPEGWM